MRQENDNKTQAITRRISAVLAGFVVAVFTVSVAALMLALVYVLARTIMGVCGG